MIDSGSHWWMVHNYSDHLFLVHNTNPNGPNRSWCLSLTGGIEIGWGDIRTIGDSYE
jgi:hypothetical protein